MFARTQYALDDGDDGADRAHHVLVAQHPQRYYRVALILHLGAQLGELLVLAASDVLHQRHHAAEAVRDLLEEERVGALEDGGQRMRSTP